MPQKSKAALCTLTLQVSGERRGKRIRLRLLLASRGGPRASGQSNPLSGTLPGSSARSPNKSTQETPRACDAGRCGISLARGPGPLPGRLGHPPVAVKPEGPPSSLHGHSSCQCCNLLPARQEPFCGGLGSAPEAGGRFPHAREGRGGEGQPAQAASHGHTRPWGHWLCQWESVPRARRPWAQP